MRSCLKNSVKWLCAISSGFMLMGCIAMEPYPDQTSHKDLTRHYEPSDGIYHKVKRGETIWSIAKAYDIPINVITSSNRIPDVARIETNQLVFIPGAKEQVDASRKSQAYDKIFKWPLKGSVMRYFNDKYFGQALNGIHISCAQGDVVRAARTGKVVFADYLTGYGMTVILDHEDGYQTVYAKQSQLDVGLDDLVFREQPIGRVGRFEGDVFFHFELRKDGIENNPLYYLPQ